MDLNTYAELERPLTAEEVDANWNAIKSSYDEMAGGFVKLAGFQVSEDGAYLVAIGTDGNPMAEIPMPAPFLNAGTWSSGNPYDNRSLVSYEDVTYLCVIPHESGADFYDDLDNGFWLPLGGGGDTAEDVLLSPIDDVEADNLQEFAEWMASAIDWMADEIDWLIDEVMGLNDTISTLNGTVADLESRVSALENP